MSWYDTLTSTPLLIAGALGITVAVYARRHTADQAITQIKEVKAAAQSLSRNSVRICDVAAGDRSRFTKSRLSPPLLLRMYC